MLDHDRYIPKFARITDAKASDLSFARTLTFPAGSIIAADRAYIDFAWVYTLNERKNFLVTFLKRNIKYKVTQRHRVLKSKGINSYQTIILTGTKSSECPVPLRRVGYRDPETRKHYIFLTNNFDLAAKTRADIYKNRWQVELFFKWLKQNLKIKTFFGTSRNAVLTQIWIALITMLVLSYMKFFAKLGQSITQIQQLLQLNLLKRQILWELFYPSAAKHKSEDSQKKVI